MNADQVADELERFTERMIVKITFDATANLTEATPVDTGWAQSNWIPRIGLEPGTPAPRPAGGGNANAAQQAGLSKVAAGYSFPEVVSISNNVPYINRLNEGHSGQAPSGFVQRAINKALTSDLGRLGT